MVWDPCVVRLIFDVSVEEYSPVSQPIDTSPWTLVADIRDVNLLLVYCEGGASFVPMYMCVPVCSCLCMCFLLLPSAFFPLTEPETQHFDWADCPHHWG